MNGAQARWVDRALMMPHDWYVAVPEPPKIYKGQVPSRITFCAFWARRGHELFRICGAVALTVMLLSLPLRNGKLRKLFLLYHARILHLFCIIFELMSFRGNTQQMPQEFFRAHEAPEDPFCRF